MPDDDEAGKQHVVEAIVGYLARCPSAADSEQGIAQWWLPRMGLDVPLADVPAALDVLVQRAVMRRTTLPDGRVIYRAAPAASTP